MTCVLQIVGLMTNGQTPFDGQFVASYNPSKDGTTPAGEPMAVELVTVPTHEGALKFRDAVEALDCWRAVDKRNPWRDDGKPNRPLTSFTVTVIQAKDKGQDGEEQEQA